jgi:hypothetical protein
MRCVSNLNNTCAWGCPAGLRVSPKKLKVDDCVWRSGVDKLLEDWCPLDLLHTRHVVHSIEHFLFVDGVVPVFLLGTRDLRMSAMHIHFISGYSRRGS